MSEQAPQHPDPKERWKNMRRMAWLALAHGFVVSFTAEADKLLYIMAFDGAVVGAYMGFSTWRDGWGNK